MDLTDMLVYEMANSNHVPEERRISGLEMQVICQMCGVTWPCETRLAIRAMDDEWREYKRQAEEAGQ